MTNAIHPKLDHDIVADFEEEDDDPIAALPFKMAQVTCKFFFKRSRVQILVRESFSLIDKNNCS